jgi:hypothetical protein
MFERQNTAQAGAARTSPDKVGANPAGQPGSDNDQSESAATQHPDGQSEPEDRAAGLLADIADAERVVARLQAAQLRAIAELDKHRAGGDLAEFVADEVSLALRISPAAARDRLELARTLTRRLRATFAALEQGRIDLYKARAIVEATARLVDPAVVADVEARVLPRAGEQTGTQLKAALRRAVAQADPDGTERRHKRAVADRRVELFPLDDGVADLWLRSLPADDAVAIYRMLDGLARAAQAEDGETRTLDQLRADALSEIAVGVLDGAGWAGRTLRPRRRAHPHLQVVVSADTLLGLTDQPGHLTDYGPIPASLARQIAEDATWQRLLSDPVSGTLVECATTSYAPGVVLDRHVTTRDQTCRFPTCTHPADNCDLDHTVPYPDGATAADNLGPLCRHHHRAKQAGFRLKQPEPGHFEWTSPTGQVYTVTPPVLGNPAPAA